MKIWSKFSSNFKKKQHIFTYVGQHMFWLFFLQLWTAHTFGCCSALWQRFFFFLGIVSLRQPTLYRCRVMSSSALTVSDQQLSALSSEGEDLSVPVDILDTYTHTHTLHVLLMHQSYSLALSLQGRCKKALSDSVRALQGGEKDLSPSLKLLRVQHAAMSPSANMWEQKNDLKKWFTP